MYKESIDHYDLYSFFYYKIICIIKNIKFLFFLKSSFYLLYPPLKIMVDLKWRKEKEKNI